MNKQDTLEFLDNRGIWYEVQEHQPVYNMEEVGKLELPYPDADAKNLFIRDDKKRNFYLLTVKGEKKIDLKEFKQKHNTRNLSFASPEYLMDILGLTPGAVSPLGLLNDEERKVVFYIDNDLVDGSGRIGVHPNENTATVWMYTKDLIDIIEEHGNTVNIVEF